MENTESMKPVGCYFHRLLQSSQLAPELAPEPLRWVVRGPDSAPTREHLYFNQFACSRQPHDTHPLLDPEWRWAGLVWWNDGPVDLYMRSCEERGMWAVWKGRDEQINTLYLPLTQKELASGEHESIKLLRVRMRLTC